ncbi:hypothetical protein JCM8202_004624 [Rhodotorula sphaerocarpa]
MAPSQLPVDLSDLDPFYSPSSSPHPQPLFSTAPTHTPSSADAAAALPAVPPAQISLATTGLAAGERDPLAGSGGPTTTTSSTTLGRIQLGSASNSPASTRSASPAPLTGRRTPTSAPYGRGGGAPVERKLVHAQEERNSRIFADLAREPFDSRPGRPDEPAASEPVSRGGRIGTPTSILTEEPIPYSSANYAATSSAASQPEPSPPIPTSSSPRRRPSTSLRQNGHPPGGASTSTTSHFSPPRRLSSLMDLNAPAAHSHAPSSPPAESNANPDPFHPASVRYPWHAAPEEGGDARAEPEPHAWSAGGAEGRGGDWRKGRGRGDSVGGGGGGHEKHDSSAEWGDFQDAAAAMVANFASLSPPSSPTGRQPTITPAASASRSATLPIPLPLPSPLASSVSVPAPLHSALNSSALSSFFGSLHPSSLEKKFSAAPAAASSPGPAPRQRGHGTAQAHAPGNGRATTAPVSAPPPLPPNNGADRDGGFVLVVKTERGEVFGGYCSEALKDASASRGPAQRWAGDGSW